MAEYWGQQASGLLIYNNQGQVLLLRRSDQVNGGRGKYAITGGRVDLGDKPKQSAEKEGRQEMGGLPKGQITGSYVFKKPLNVGDIVYLSGESEGDPDGKQKVIKKSGENFEYHTFFFLSQEDDWEPIRLNWEHDDSEWMDARKAATDSRVFEPVRTMLKNGFLKHLEKNPVQQKTMKFEDIARRFGSCLRMS